MVDLGRVETYLVKLILFRGDNIRQLQTLQQKLQNYVRKKGVVDVATANYCSFTMIINDSNESM